MLEIVNDIVINSITIILIIINVIIKFSFNQISLTVVNSSLFISPSSKLVVLEKMIITWKFKSDNFSMRVSFFNKLFPTRIRLYLLHCLSVWYFYKSFELKRYFFQYFKLIKKLIKFQNSQNFYKIFYSFKHLKLNDWDLRFKYNLFFT